MKTRMLTIGLILLSLPGLNYSEEQTLKDEEFQKFLRVMKIEEGKNQRAEASRRRQEEGDRQLRQELCDSIIESESCNEKITQYYEERRTRFSGSFLEALEKAISSTKARRAWGQVMNLDSTGQ